MANPENVREYEQPDHASDRERRFAIQATPDPHSGVVFQKAPDGGVSISFQGRVTIDLPQAIVDVTGAVGSAPPDTGYRLIADGTLLPDEATPASQHHEQAIPEVITHHITKALDSDVRPSETPANGLGYQGALPSVSATNTAALTCPPVKDPDNKTPNPPISRNRKTKSLSLSATQSP
jgi:hypothetical protein